MKQIPLTKGKFAIVDDEDYALVNRFSWCWIKAGAQARIGNRRILMHRLILDPPAGTPIDHINHDRSDNRRSNIRIASATTNAWNKSAKTGRQFKGIQDRFENREVPRSPRVGRYRARIRCNGVTFDLGRFHTAEEAAGAYDAKARELFGEFACVNFPLPHELDRQNSVAREIMPERLERTYRFHHTIAEVINTADSDKSTTELVKIGIVKREAELEQYRQSLRTGA